MNVSWLIDADLIQALENPSVILSVTHIHREQRWTVGIFSFGRSR